MPMQYAIVLAASLLFFPYAARGGAAASVDALLGQSLHDLGGKSVGALEDIVVDVRGGRVVYVMVDGPERFYTLPVRALDERLRLDMSLAGELAHERTGGDERFRRAGRLLGKEVTHPGGKTIGTIQDIRFDPRSGKVEEVMVRTAQGETAFPASVLAHGRFPPLTRWQAEHPSPAGAGGSGFLRGAPSRERERLHDHEWDRN